MSNENTLETEYEKTVNLISQKLVAAGLLMEEVNHIAANSNLDLMELDSSENIMSPVFNQMRKAGWSTSSLSC